MNVQVRSGYNPDVLGPCTTKIGLMQNSFFIFLQKFKEKAKHPCWNPNIIFGTDRNMLEFKTTKISI